MRRSAVLALVWTLPTAVFLAVTFIVFHAYRIAPPHRLDARGRACAMAPLRAALDGRDAAPCELPEARGLIGVTVWSKGRAIARIDGVGDTLAAALDSAAHQLRQHPAVRMLDAAARTAARIQIDVIGDRAPLGTGNWLFARLALPGTTDILAIDPGLDGVGGEIAGKRVMLLPHELVSYKLLATKRPSDDMPDLAMGVDLPRIGQALAARAGSHVQPTVNQLWRFRTDAFVEPPEGSVDRTPLQLVRGLPPAPKLSAGALRTAALAGAHYLVDHLGPNGRYLYEHDLLTGHTTDPKSNDYSMPRHGGTTYFLAQLYRITKEPWLREPIERAFAHLADLMSQGHCAGTLPDGTAFDCVLDRNDNIAGLGSTALVVVALAEYQRATGDPRYLPLATKLAAWLLFMQRPDGSFRHRYNTRTHQPDEHAQELYYSGEASLALVRMYTVTNDRKYLDAAEKGIDWLVDWYDFFLGGFFYGEEHWTCIAAEAIWPDVAKPKYDEFCRGYGEFLRDQQLTAGELDDEEDLAGAYGVTPFVVPNNTPVGSRTEAMISAYLLGEHHGDPDPRIRDQIIAALQYALGQQLRPDSDFAVVGDADGGMPGSSVERTVRIDFVQHVCSAMIRASEWIDVVN
ncbi:MAG TPA: beta-L-arabinofuranosidase domain-containing protein [Kofleriaceae bacterium]|jgi:hypothetical protein